jgi:Icc-related predicted phosphoesterase
MVLLCLSDIHGDKAGLERVMDSEAEADAVVISGDLTHKGRREDAEAILKPILGKGKPVFAVAGNMDPEGVRAYIRELGIDIHGRGIALNGVGMQGLGGSNPTPFGTPFELGDEEAAALLEAGRGEISSLPCTILVSHAPPKDTKTDMRMGGWHVGSDAVRAFILKAQPDLCICGHIHESAAEDHLGRTLCVNIGSYRSGTYAVIRVDGNRAEISWRKK